MGGGDWRKIAKNVKIYINRLKQFTENGILNKYGVLYLVELYDYNL